jgi:hypothetical protein
MSRHARQVALKEVGLSGQTRIRATTVEVPLEGLAAEIAVRYLAGAGVGRLRVRDARLAEIVKETDPSVAVAVDDQPSGVEPVDVLGLGNGPAGDLARGAHAALRALRAAIEHGA